MEERNVTAPHEKLKTVPLIRAQVKGSFFVEEISGIFLGTVLKELK